MSTAEDAPFEIRRADFLALAWAVIGAVYLLIELVPFAGGGSVDPAFVGIGLVWFAGAGYCHLRPNRMNKGNEPTPRTWFELAGVLVSLSALALVILLLL